LPGASSKSSSPWGLWGRPSSACLGLSSSLAVSFSTQPTSSKITTWTRSALPPSTPHHRQPPHNTVSHENHDLDNSFFCCPHLLPTDSLCARKCESPYESYMLCPYLCRLCLFPKSYCTTGNYCSVSLYSYPISGMILLAVHFHGGDEQKCTAVAHAANSLRATAAFFPAKFNLCVCSTCGPASTCT